MLGPGTSQPMNAYSIFKIGTNKEWCENFLSNLTKDNITTTAECNHCNNSTQQHQKLVTNHDNRELGSIQLGSEWSSWIPLAWWLHGAAPLGLEAQAWWLWLGSCLTVAAAWLWFQFGSGSGCTQAWQLCLGSTIVALVPVAALACLWLGGSRSLAQAWQLHLGSVSSGSCGLFLYSVDPDWWLRHSRSGLVVPAWLWLRFWLDLCTVVCHGSGSGGGSGLALVLATAHSHNNQTAANE